MKPVIMRKVPYRIPKSNRLVWAIILGQAEGLSLLFVQRPDQKSSHTIVIATENVSERVFENVNTSRFPLEHEDLVQIGCRLNALGDGLGEDEFSKLFDFDDL